MAITECAIGVLTIEDDPSMTFDSAGRSNYFTDYKLAEQNQVFVGEEGENRLKALVSRIKLDGKNRPYDCIIGLSGGVDSTYVAHLARSLGLRPLAVHLDNGWNSELAVKNIQNIVDRLGFELHTEVLDWENFRALQLAYLRASVVDIEVVSDHAIFTTAYRLAQKNGIRHILSGTNVVTEFVMPPQWIFNKMDHVNIKAIHKAYGTRSLKGYPLMNWRLKKWAQTVLGIQTHSILNLVPYNKKVVKQFISDELGWRDYGGKHYESIFTRFYQGYILPQKFGIDKRKAHLTNLIYSGQMTKIEAKEELSQPALSADTLKTDYDYVLKKLNLSGAEFDVIMSSPEVPHSNFKMEQAFFDEYNFLRIFRDPISSFSRLLLRRNSL